MLRSKSSNDSLSAIKGCHGSHFLPPAIFPVFFLEQLTVAFNNCQAIRKVLKLISQVDYRFLETLLKTALSNMTGYHLPEKL